MAALLASQSYAMPRFPTFPILCHNRTLRIRKLMLDPLNYEGFVGFSRHSVVSSTASAQHFRNYYSPRSTVLHSSLFQRMNGRRKVDHERPRQLDSVHEDQARCVSHSDRAPFSPSANVLKQAILSTSDQLKAVSSLTRYLLESGSCVEFPTRGVK